MRNLTLFLIFVISFLNQGYAQVRINELDSDSEGVDDQEFIELKSEDPYFELDGYVLVFFNGSNAGQDRSYFTIDLTGYQTDVNGILLIGSRFVQPFPQVLIAPNTIQNGADAVGLYEGNAYEYEDETPASPDNLIDALVYGTNDDEATSLLSTLNLTEQIDEDLNGQKDFESIQRNGDGSYFVGTPTPRMTNDGSGIPQIPVRISIDSDQYTEGETFQVQFSTEQELEEDLTFSFDLDNGSFDFSDFYGSTTVTIDAGDNSTQVYISLIDDDDDEGDEEMFVRFDSLPEYFIPLNNQVLVRAVDNDFTVANFGTPTDPTYDVVERTGPADYYNSLDETAGEDLREALQAIIADETVVRAQTYADVFDILKKADQSPLNSNKVWLVYTEKTLPKLDVQGFENSDSLWNREHTFPRSRGGFYSIEADDIADGKDNYWNTNADSTRHGNSDAHALRAVLSSENSARNNRYYGDYTGPENTQGSFKGDVARSVLYMAIRYNELSVAAGFPETPQVMGDLDTLLAWHRQDPPDDYEMHRNNVVYEWQKNRNPFIDQPELVEYIWGNDAGHIWQQQLATNEHNIHLKATLYPNPNKGNFSIKGASKNLDITVFNLTGKKVAERKRAPTGLKMHFNLKPGVYLVKLKSGKRSTIKKMIVN